MIEVTKDGKKTIDNTVKLRLEELFLIENTIFLFKLIRRLTRLLSKLEQFKEWI
jgi:hypothetical protein